MLTCSLFNFCYFSANRLSGPVTQVEEKGRPVKRNGRGEGWVGGCDSLSPRREPVTQLDMLLV